jgi:hypothetical protein
MEKDGKPLSFLLDIVEVAMSHSGINLARAFADMLKEFGVEHKVSPCHTHQNDKTHHKCTDLGDNMRQCNGKQQDDNYPHASSP